MLYINSNLSIDILSCVGKKTIFNIHRLYNIVETQVPLLYLYTVYSLKVSIGTYCLPIYMREKRVKYNSNIQ